MSRKIAGMARATQNKTATSYVIEIGLYFILTAWALSAGSTAASQIRFNSSTARIAPQDANQGGAADGAPGKRTPKRRIRLGMLVMSMSISYRAQSAASRCGSGGPLLNSAPSSRK